MNGIEKRYIKPFGNALVAVHAFAPGDIVLHDRPLIVTTEKTELLDDIFVAHSELGIRADLLGKDASIDFTLQMLQYCAASAEVRAGVLELFTPDTEEFRDEPYVRAARQYAAQLDRSRQAQVNSGSVLTPIYAACLGSDEIVRVVLAWVCNSYATRDGGGALYKVGSLVNHCCEGNTRYRFVDDGQGEGGGCGVFIAVRQLLPGEVITTCYLGWDEQTLMSTRMRQKLLVKTKLFTCTCVRCSSRTDPYRALPCPRCNPTTPSVNPAAADHTASAHGSDTPPSATTVTDSTGAAITGSASAHRAGATTVMLGSDDHSDVGDGDGGADEGCPAPPGSRPDPGPATEASRALAVGPGPGPSSGSNGGELGSGSGGFVYWTDASADAVAGAGGSSAGRGDVCSHPQPPTAWGPETQSYWECDTCGGRFGSTEMQRELRCRAAAVGMVPEVWRQGANGTAEAGDTDLDPELVLEEEVQGVGDQLDWTDLAVSLGAVRQLGARCQAVLGQRHWTTNRCRYTVLDLCTTALTRTCAASRTATSACSGGAGGRLPEVGGSVGGGSYCSVAAAAGAAGSGWGWFGGFSGSGAGVPWRFGSSGGGPRPVVEVPLAAAASKADEDTAAGTGRGAGGGDGDRPPLPHQRASLPATEAVGAAVTAQEESGGDGDLDCGRVDTGLAAATAPGSPDVSASRGGGLRDARLSEVSGLRALEATAAAVAVVASAGGEGPAASPDVSTARGPAVQGSTGPVPPLQLPHPPQQQQPQPQQPQVVPSHDGRPFACEAPGTALVGQGGGDTETVKPASPAGSGPVLVPEPGAAFFLEASATVLESAVSPEEGAPHVNPHLGRAALRQHTLHHHTLHQQQLLHRRQQQQQQQRSAGELDNAGSCQAAQRQAASPPQPPPALTAEAGSSPPRKEVCCDTGGYGGGGDPAAVGGREPQAAAQQQQQQQQNPPVSPAPQAPESQPAPDTVGGGAAAEAASVASLPPSLLPSLPPPPPPAPDVLTPPQEPLPPLPPLPLSEVGAVRSVGGSTLWGLPLLEVDGMVDCMCEELQALWQWQHHHTPHEPAVVLKAVAGPAATALMDVVKDELCSGGRLSSRALALAEAVASRLAAAYEAAPFYDVSGEAYEEAVTVVQLAPLIRAALDLEPQEPPEGNAGPGQEKGREGETDGKDAPDAEGE
ncbi:hypothetical protein PLESTB_000594800 [Pleodorina starrii]|uniref:SET domain-containing protein n=1 Tax=Pleodorina starrii TaxID=330485 RepID=A0A9W6BIT3_9CHLO|nr:hypothetical protein PLESTB_000594800 [Pleodorina starrii]